MLLVYVRGCHESMVSGIRHRYEMLLHDTLWTCRLRNCHTDRNATSRRSVDVIVPSQFVSLFSEHIVVLLSSLSPQAASFPAIRKPVVRH